MPLPRVAERTGRPRPLPRAVVARALTPSTLIQGAGTDPGVAGMLGRMLRSVPTLGLDDLRTRFGAQAVNDRSHLDGLGPCSDDDEQLHEVPT